MGCGIFEMWNVGFGFFAWIWDVGDARFWGCEMFRMWNVGCRIFARIWNDNVQNPFLKVIAHVIKHANFQFYWAYPDGITSKN